MPVIDAQIHAYERNRPERPWATTPDWPPEMTGDDMVREMAKVGVDGAIFVSAFSMYRFDASYAVEVRNKFPNKFALVKPVDPNDPGVVETIEDWAKTDGAVGIRLMFDRFASSDPAHAGTKRVLDAAARLGLPINLLCWGMLEEMKPWFAAARDDVKLVIDHLGMKQPAAKPVPPAAESFADLPLLLDLARHRNVVVKITGACTYSEKPYPFPDIWDPLARIFDAFGFERCLWGTDWTRTTHVVNYHDGVEPFRLTDRLSDAERDMLMGGAAIKTYGWSPS